MPTVLVTNDDGINSPGLYALAAAAHAMGLETTIYAPDCEASGSGAALAAHTTNGHIHVRVCQPSKLAQVDTYAVNAQPALISLAAMTGYCGPIPEVVLSGINDGANVGTALPHSGTFSAALVAAAHGARAMAVSLEGTDSHTGHSHWDSATHIASTLLPDLLAGPPGHLLNVNVPARPRSTLRDTRTARLGTGGIDRTVEKFVTSRSGWPTVPARHPVSAHSGHGATPEAASQEAPDSDVALLHNGHPTVTPIELGKLGASC